MSTDFQRTVDGVASGLTLSPKPLVGCPPTRPPIHVLPLGSLHWDDFERLCWRLVALRGEVRQTTLYGEPGQGQHGIDLYAELTNGSFAVFQCKKREKMRPAEIRAAVDAFLKGPWRDRAKTFVLCTTVSLRERKLAEAVVEETKRLNAMGIAFERLDLEQISGRSKAEPDLVWDFFGPDWARAFCGPQLADGLRDRLRPEEVTDLRKRLRDYYLLTFGEHDLVPPPLSTADIADLDRRFVLPDVVERRAVERGGLGGGQERPDSRGLGLQTSPVERSPPDAAEPQRRASGQLVVRQPVGPWVAEGDRTVIVGDAGSGKSTLLRFIACDLLAQEPRLGGLAARCAGHTPVWIPFPAWVRRIAAGGSQTSPRDVVSAWLTDRGQRDLVPLIQRAFDDGRLVLIVDGLDEYLDEVAARDAFQRLLVLQGQLRVPLIAAGRSGPTHRLRSNFDGFRVAELAPCDEMQRAALARQWFAAQSGEQGRATPEDVSGRFLHHLAASPDASRLASCPLFLIFLLRVWSNAGELPRTRTDLLRQVVDLLIKEHPLARRTASGTSRPDHVPHDEDVVAALACLAFAIRERGFSMPEQRARSTLRGFLTDTVRGLGLADEVAHKNARQLLGWLSDGLGALAADGGNVALPHRALLEYLSATWLSGAGTVDQTRAIEAHACDPGWVEVWPDLIALVDESDDATRLLEALLALRRAAPGAFHLDRAIGAAAIASGPLPAQARHRVITDLANGVVENGWWPHRAELVRSIARGLLCPHVTTTVNGILGEWIPGKEGRHGGLLFTIGGWDPAAHLTPALLRGLLSENDRTRLAAAERLPRHALQGPPLALRRLAASASDPVIRASALVAYARGWPAAPETIELVRDGLATGSPELAVASWLLQLRQGHRPELPLDVLGLSGRECHLSHAFQSVLRDVLAEAWAGQLDKRDAMLRLHGADGRGARAAGSEVDRDAVFEIVVRGFPGDDAVAQHLASNIREGAHMAPWGSWPLLATHFRRHPLLVRAVDQWLSAGAQHSQSDRAHAAIASGTQIARDAMLADLERRAFPWWPARVLLDEWSEDADVRIALRAFAEVSPKNASSVGHLLARIWDDPVKARARLVELVGMPSVYRRDAVIDGLGELDGSCVDAEAAEAICEALADEAPAHSFAWAAAFASFLWHPRVEARAASVLNHPEPPLTSIAQGAVHAPRLQTSVLQGATPLDTELRRALWEELALMGPASVAAMEWLRRYDEETDPAAKTTAALAWYRSAVPDTVSVQDAIARIAQDVACRGMEYETRRQAAFAAAIELDAVGILLGRHTEGMPDHPVSVRVAASAGVTNPPFLEVIARAWPSLESAYGLDLPRRLGAEHLADPKRESNIFYSDGSFEALLLQGGACVALDRWLLDRLDRAQGRFGSEAVLDFLRRSRPRSRMLMDFCMGTLEKCGDSSYWFAMQSRAAEILAETFPGHEGLRRRLETGPVEAAGVLDLGQFPTHVYALALGWPASEALDRLRFDRGALDADPFVEGVVTCTLGTSLEITNLLLRWFDADGFRAKPGHGLSAVLGRSVINHPDLTAALIGLMQLSPRHFVSLASIVSANATDPTVRQLISEEFARQAATNRPALAMNIFTGRVVSLLEVTARLLDGRPST